MKNKSYLFLSFIFGLMLFQTNAILSMPFNAEAIQILQTQNQMNGEPIPNDGDGECGSVRAGVLSYSKDTYRLTDEMKRRLEGLAIDMNNNPSCKTVITGHGNGDKFQQELSWDRVNTLIEYMVTIKKIDRERFIFIDGGGGKPDTVDYRGATENEDGPESVPPPFPNLRK